MNGDNGVVGYLATPQPGAVLRGQVRAVYARSVHVWSGDRCLTLGVAGLPAHPCSILWAGFPDAWAVGQEITVTSETVFGPRGRLVALGSLKRLAPRPVCRAMAASGRIAAALGSCQALAAAMPTKGGFHEVFLRCLRPAPPSAHDALSGIFTRQEKRLALALARRLRLRNWDGLAGAARALAGLGIGLTPAGDDFLAGVLAALRHHGACLPQPLLPQERLSALAGELSARTTPFSGFLLRCAASGHVAEPIGDWLDAVHAGDAAAALRSLRQLEGLGHSSGLDAFTGLLLTLQILMGERAWIEA